MWLLGKKKHSLEQVVEPGILQISLDKLKQIGDASKTWNWADGEPDYPTEYGLGREHIPSLIELAKQWEDCENYPEGNALYAPVHAWRALGQLRAVEAVAPLLAMQNALDDEANDWHLNEFHSVFGLIGPPAIPQLADYIADTNNGEFPRTSAVEGLEEIAKRNPDFRNQIVKLFTGQLKQHQQKAYTLNGFLVSSLLELGAVEAAEEIEKAFAAGIVEEGICGDWAIVQKELGVEGLGIAPIPDEPRVFQLHSSGRLLRSLTVTSTDPHSRNRNKKSKEKAKRKRQQQSRKRNHKAK